MEGKHAETLSAFFDGERVDAELLAESLAQPGSSAVLAEFAVMRAHVEQDACRPTPGFLQATAEELRHSRARRLWRGRFAKLALAASLLLAVGAAGFRLGSVAESQRNRQAAQVVSRPLSTATEVKTIPPPPSTPPAANVVTPSKRRPLQQTGGPPIASLRLRFGQWRERSSLVDAEGQRH
jgi:negative regulator of sigma E activity